MRKDNRGLTLPELLVTTAILSLTMVLVFAILRSGEEQARVSDAKMELQRSVREGLHRMSLEVRESSPTLVAIAPGGGSLTFQVPANVSNLGLVTWSPPIIYQIGGNGRQLVRLDTATGQTTVLANDIQNVIFTATGNPTALISFNVTAQRTTIDGRPLSVASTGEVQLRN